jgi:hypothetical protein
MGFQDDRYANQIIAKTKRCEYLLDLQSLNPRS